MSTKPKLFFLMIILFFSACTKSVNDTDNGNDNNGEVKPPDNYLTHTSYSSTVSTTVGNFKEGRIFNYDKANNTVTVYTSDTFSNGISPDTIICKLAGDIITINHKVSSSTEIYYLNKNLTYIDSSLIISGNIKNVYSYVNTFDANNKITSSTITSITYVDGTPGTPTTQISNDTWQNGNRVKSGNSSYAARYTFDENILAAAPDPIMMLYNPIGYFFPNKNIIKGYTLTNFFNNSVDNFICSYDNKGRIVQSVGSNSLYGATYLNINTYY